MTTVETHCVTFERNRFHPPLWRARCTCGWIGMGTEETVTKRAATHDLDELAQPPPIP